MKIKEQGEQFVMINPADAQSRSINEGDTVKVLNDRGEFEAVARISDDVNAGVCVATLGYWGQLNKGTVNITSSAEFGEMDNCPTFFDNLVQVEAAR